MDFPLNFEGRVELEKESENIRKKVLKYNPQKIYSSDLGRASFTAKKVFSRALPIRKTKVIRELNCGKCSGMTQETMKRIFPDWNKEREENNWSYPYPGGENLPQFCDRVWKFTKKVIGQNIDSQKAVVFVTHGGVFRAMRNKLENLEIQEAFNYSPKNLEVLLYEISRSSQSEGEFEVISKTIL